MTIGRRYIKCSAMNTWSLKIVLLSFCFTCCYDHPIQDPEVAPALICDFGWVPAKGTCYKIVTRRVNRTNLKSCDKYATSIHNSLAERFGFSEIVWIKERGKKPLAIDFNRKIYRMDDGMFYSLCMQPRMEPRHFKLYRNIQFDDDRWMIPNTHFNIDETNKFLRENSFFDMVWVGVVSNGSLFWSDGLEVTQNQENLLGINKTNVKNGHCGVYSVDLGFSFLNCSEHLSGLGMSGVSDAGEGTYQEKSTTKSTRLTSTGTTELTTETEEQFITESNISNEPSPVTELIMVTEDLFSDTDTSDEMATEIGDIFGIGGGRSNITHEKLTGGDITTTNTPENNTVSNFTTERSPMLCYCPCNRPKVTKEQFMESIKGLKIKKTEVSSYIRSKTSAPDDRTSSRAIGTVAVVIMAIPFGLIILSDLPLIIQPVLMYLRKK